MCLPEARVAAVEEHLLVCAGCQDRLAHWDEYLRAMRGAMRVIGEKRTGTAGAARSV